MHPSVVSTFPPQMIAFSPPFLSTRRLLGGMAASAASSPGANLKVGDLRAALMGSAVIGYTRAPKREAWRVHPPSLPPCQLRRKKICQRKILSITLNFTNPSTWKTTRDSKRFLKPIFFFLPKFSMASALMKEDN